MEQTRKKFLKHFLIGATSVPLILDACKKKDVIAGTGTGTGSGSGSGSGTCAVAPTETEGPFPTHTPSSYLRSDIRDDRTGVAITIKVTIKNTNNSCAALAGAIVDIWHCDKDGNYSEYGGSGMQSTNYTAVHFLRGRQTTDANGLVTFTSIFPGWYSGRATHIHVHVYNAAGTSLLVTQIAFPEGSSSAVATVNGSAGTAYGYTKGMTGYTYNASDNVFSDDTSGVEIAVVTGSLSAGYTLTQTINAAA
jgi:Dioxygenase